MKIGTPQKQIINHKMLSAMQYPQNETKKVPENSMSKKIWMELIKSRWPTFFYKIFMKARIYSAAAN